MTDTSESDKHRPPKLLDQVRDAIRLKHYSIRTEAAYADWIIRSLIPDNNPKSVLSGITSHDNTLSV